MLDVNGDGACSGAQDFRIEILGKARTLSIDASGEFLVFG